MLKFLKDNFAQLRRIPNVVGGGIGKRIRGNRIENEDVVHVFVSQKTPEHGMAPQDIIPKQLWVHGEKDAVPTDILAVGQIKCLNNRQTKRPIHGGLSISNALSGAIGTMGIIIKDLSDNQPVILSNNHVMARQNAASIGENIVQPGWGDDVGGGVIGHLKRFINISFSTPNLVDGAIADIDIENFEIGVSHIGIPRGTSSLTAGDIVQKSGRTSEHTIGTVLSTNALVVVDYPSGSAEFENQTITSRILSPGDSGSVLFTADYRFAGLGFAGSDEISVFNTASDILQTLNIGFFEFPVIASYKNPSRGSFFYRETDDQNHDADFLLSTGDAFLLYPDLATTQTALLKRWKSTGYPTQYILAINSPGINYIEDAVLGRIGTNPMTESLPLNEWLDTVNGNRYYTTSPSGGGIDLSRFTNQGTIGHVVPVNPTPVIL